MSDDATPILGSPDAVAEALILAGGQGRRLGGVSKADVACGPHTLLAHCVAALPPDWRPLVIGRAAGAPPRIRVIREQPPGAGPAHALIWSAQHLQLRGAWVAVLAVDMPLVSLTTWARLEAAPRAEVDVVCLSDPTGRRQPLCGLYRVSALASLTRTDQTQSLRGLLAGLRVHDVPASGAETLDVDDPGSLTNIADLLATRANPDHP